MGFGRGCFAAVLWDKGSSATGFSGLSVWGDMELGLPCFKAVVGLESKDI